MDLPDLTENEILLGHVETDTGSVTIVDSMWNDDLPKVVQDRLNLELGLDKCRIPVFGFKKNGKRYLLLALDDAEKTPSIEGVVPTTTENEDESG